MKQTPSISPPRRNLAAEAVASLRQEILSGKLPPGQTIAEPSLAKRLGLSRVPVREALIELERDGLLQFESTGRTRVRTLDESDLKEIIETRVVLESAAVRRVAAIWNKTDTQWMESNIAEQMEASTLAELSRLDVELHQYIIRRAGNTRLLRMWQVIRWQFEMYLSFTHRVQETLAFKPHQITVASHRRLLKALASGNPDLAALTMSSHIENSMEWSPGYTALEQRETHALGSVKQKR